MFKYKCIYKFGTSSLNKKISIMNCTPNSDKKSKQRFQNAKVISSHKWRTTDDLVMV